MLTNLAEGTMPGTTPFPPTRLFIGGRWVGTLVERGRGRGALVFPRIVPHPSTNVPRFIKMNRPGLLPERGLRRPASRPGRAPAFDLRQWVTLSLEDSCHGET